MSSVKDRTVKTSNIRGDVEDIPGLSDYIVGLGYSTEAYVDAAIAELVIIANAPSAKIALNGEVVTGYCEMVNVEGRTLKLLVVE